MSRLKNSKPPQPTGIPKWFVTYSDVITLLMTFFILLMTFASNEVERFAMIKQSLFGAGGSKSDLAVKQKGLERNSVVLRVRPSASRIQMSGSETPPVYSDVTDQAVADGLKALDEANDLAASRRIRIDIAPGLLFTADGRLTDMGQRHLDLLERQLRKLPLNLEVQVDDRNRLAGAIQLTAQLQVRLLDSPGRVAAAWTGSERPLPTGLRLILEHRP